MPGEDGEAEEGGDVHHRVGDDERLHPAPTAVCLGGRPLYDFVRPHTEKGFTYPPFAILVLLPPARGTEATAIDLPTAVPAGLVVLTTWWLVAPIAVRHGWPRWLALGVAVLLVHAMEPIREAIGSGQIDVVIAALVLADVALLRRGRPWACVWIGLATAIKVPPGLFVIYLAGTRRWRAAAAAAAIAEGNPRPPRRRRTQSAECRRQRQNSVTCSASARPRS